MIELRIAPGCAPTGRLLQRLLAERFPVGHSSQVEAIVSWGCRVQSELPTLNANAGRLNKLEELETLTGAGIRVPPYALLTNDTAVGFPCLARKLKHCRGEDIHVCLQRSDAAQLRQLGLADFFTRYVPGDTEYRTWIYRRRHLGTYEKRLTRLEEWAQRRRVGRNYANGYSFELVMAPYLPRTAIDLAARAVDALGLDFGAVDILYGEDNQYYVLEVNTAPGVEGPKRQVIQGLADRIVRWVNARYPRRRGDAA